MNYLHLLPSLISVAHSGCFFPTELQGNFASQWLASVHEISYTQISILYNSIPGWGECYYRERERVVLREESVRGECFKCVRLVQRSRNVNQVHIRDINQCFVTGEEALENCPSDDEIGTVTEMMLYRTGSVQPVHCPITGRHIVEHCGGRRKAGEGARHAGEAGGCPSESMLNFKLSGSGCQSETGTRELSFQCLGHWTGEDGMLYLSLLDTVLPQLGEKPRPRYRCAIYHANRDTGVTHMALSNDSTCVNQLDSHLSGDEVFTLTVPDGRIPDGHSLDRLEVLPAWSQGKWDSVEVRGADLTYRSEERLTTYHMRAIISPAPGMFLAKVETECGEQGFACLALHSRQADSLGSLGSWGAAAAVIMEMKIGRIDSRLDDVSCSDSALGDNLSLTGWVTQVRDRVACPLSGEWQGVIPDAEGLCARSVTSCDRPDQMKYQVYNCNNQMEVYEDRLYQCYGQFHHQELVYTLTKRMDLPKQECFVGVPTHDGKHKIMEAGEHCQRGKQPHLYGMDMEMVRAPQLECGMEETEDNQTYNNEENTDDADDATEVWLKLLHPKLKLQTIVQAENMEEIEEVEDITNEDIDTNMRRKYTKHTKFVSSSSSLACLTLSVISLAVSVRFFV